MRPGTETALQKRIGRLETRAAPAIVTGYVTTTDATVTTVLTITLDVSTTTLIEAYILGRRTGGAAGAAEDGAAYLVRGVYKVIGGVATQIGLTQSVVGEDQAGWDGTLNVSGQTVRVRVTGAAANNVAWKAETQIWKVAT